MDEENNLRFKIEKLFTDNPEASFSVSEIANKFNAMRNTVHYHLKILRERAFLQQNDKDEYYLHKATENDVMKKKGIIPCRYHSQKLNVEWCPSCGNPICEDCVTTTSTLMNIGYPLTCPECNRKKVDKFMKILISILLVFFFIFPMILSTSQDSLLKTNGIIATAMAGVLYLFYLNTWLKGIKHYKIWKRTIDGHDITDENVRALIQNKELQACKYHRDMAGINTCEKCGSIICVKCSTIGPGFPTRRVLCIDCNWPKERRFLKFILGYLTVVAGLLMAVFLLVVITVRQPMPLSFYFVMIPIITALIMVILLVHSIYMKKKNKFYSWKNNIVDTTLE